MSNAHWQARRLPIPAAWPARSSPAARLWAVVPAALAPVLLTGGYLVAGALQPASYSPVRKTISVMAGQAGTDRWIMTGGIFLAGGCYLVTAAGLTGVRAAKAGHTAIVTAPSTVQARCRGVAPLAGTGDAAMPMPARPATISRARAGARTPVRPAAVTR